MTIMPSPVVGQNGSGKSAVLTALTVCLGAKASFTNRAEKIVDLIKRDKQTASIKVVIKNQGEDAYRHADYGDRITIERKFAREGGGNGYVISGADGTAND